MDQTVVSCNTTKEKCATSFIQRQILVYLIKNLKKNPN